MLDVPTLNQRLTKVLESLRKELSSLRTGQASVDLVEDILVDYYGVPTPMKQMAAISVPEPRMIMISPWDKSAISAIEKAILKAKHLGLNPVGESNGVRLMIPPLTEERRKQLAKEASTKAENYRAEMRRVRDDIRGEIKDQLKKKEISEDESRADLDKIDEIVKDKQAELESAVAAKEQEILTV